MLRLFNQPGVRVATRCIVQQRIQFRGFTNGFGDEGDLLEPGEKQEALRSEDKKQWGRSDNDRLWDYVNKLDDRVAGLSKDPRGFKGDVNKSIGELGRVMEKGFGDIKKEMATMQAELKSEIGDIKSEFKFTKWQVHLIFGGTTAVLVWLVKDYAEPFLS